MPALDLYANASEGEPSQPQKLQPASEFQTTRENSREPLEDDKNIAPAPMGSLYEATQLGSLRTRLRRPNPRKRNVKRRMETDMVSQNLLSIADAEELLQLFKRSLSRYLFNTSIPEDISLISIRESSTVLFTALMLVSALHVPGKEAIHAICHKQFLELVSTAMFDRFHTLDDVRGLCIAAFWQPDLSWKLSGLCIRMATELNLHHAFYKAFYTPGLTEGERAGHMEKARVWYLLYVLDHHFSIAYGRPPVTAELLPIREYSVFVNNPSAMPSDRRLLSQVSLFVILSKAYEVFGLEPDRMMGSDDATLLTHMRFTDETRSWRDHWRDALSRDKYVGDYPAKGVILHHGFTELVLNSLALRGQPLERLDDLPTSLRPLASRAIDAAHFILQYTMEEVSYRESLVGIPLYLHSMIAFAAVFLMKIAHKWHTIGVNIDPETQTKPLIEGMIRTLRGCKAGANHMVFSMASGFERLLKQWGKGAHNGVPQRSVLSRPNGPRRTQSGTVLTPSMHSSPEYTIGQNNDPTLSSESYEVPLTAMSGYSYGGWGQDDMLWSVGMGYDLLAPNGYDSTEFPSSYFLPDRHDSMHQPS
ncbi:hypothetical protein LTR70_004704 [Exophiala xenobiotica]|uniref:Xylanolytic transcriptional activator regulatory domain-containing protein n=1 Tax=Lithohypha guttulata TaxID=1690604 RepID=A0ABR0KC48_9EURO|nr:hypothetical protein LTR24_004320 [Lithohypha guttulata]KAK5319920.1 hypothetical protein LTR70_004704 [Exophiala xenobiotica]